MFAFFFYIIYQAAICCHKIPESDTLANFTAPILSQLSETSLCPSCHLLRSCHCPSPHHSGEESWQGGTCSPHICCTCHHHQALVVTSAAGGFQGLLLVTNSCNPSLQGWGQVLGHPSSFWVVLVLLWVILPCCLGALPSCQFVCEW
jgi:hypothetical protein